MTFHLYKILQNACTILLLLQARGRKLLDCINTKDFESITKLLQEGVDFGVTDVSMHK